MPLLDLRRLFDKYRVSWRDRGSNCSQGNVNIPCPWCRTDPSYHLAVAEDATAYYCFRNHQHSGRSLVSLFNILRIPLSELPKDKQQPVTQREEKVDNRVYSSWSYFMPACDDDEALKYLRSRHFESPYKICTQFNLRVMPRGSWAGRLLIPLTVGWTGRSMRANIQPRYFAYTDESGYFFHGANSNSLILFEGGLDAMRVASVSYQFDVIGKCGNRLSPALLFYLRSKQYLTIYNVPDGDVPYHQHELETRTLATYCFNSNVKKLDVPIGVDIDGKNIKDTAQLQEADTRLWLRHYAV